MIVPTVATTPSKLMSKYGDGFVTSSSHPELAEQYGNVGTSNPYGGAARPGTAAAVLGQPQVSKAPVSGTFDPSAPPEVNADHQHIKDGLMEILEMMQGMQLSPADKKQLTDGEKGVAILLKRLARGDVDAEVAGKVSTLVEAIRGGDYFTATSVQTGLVSSDWREHKDWLKGIKNLMQLIIKKSQGR
jgi:protein transport protein SEC31